MLMDWLSNLIDAGRRLAPHGYCLLWDPGLVWTHVVADALIAAAYFSIPVALVLLVRKRRDLEFSWIFWLFAIFIIACGGTHLMSIWTLWNADYGWEALLKIVTAISSIGTAIVLWPLIPKLIAIPSPVQLRTQNEALESTLTQLTHEMAQRKRAEDALRQAHKMEAVGQLTGGIAHDFNNLLQAVTASFGLIGRQPRSDKVGEWVALGRRAADRGAKLTAQLLTFSRAQHVALRPCPVVPLLTGMRELLQSAIGPTSVAELALAAPEDAHVLGDPTQIELAVMNLAINARDAMPAGGTITISTEVVEVTDDHELQDGAYLKISVEDHGVGMSPDVASRAFDPFFTTKGIGKGTGLGLSMVYGVARQAGGRAEIESRADRGTIVSILLRVVDPGAESSEDRRPDVPELQPRKILVVDDDDDVRLLTAAMLEALGHEVREAPNGAIALAMAEEEAPDFIVLDYAMPGINGATVAKRMRKMGIAAPILFASGFADRPTLAKAVGKNAHVILKPYSLTALAEAIAETERAAAGQTPASRHRKS
jgi:signal transduction histidine kinase/CheY-like chemotaxis protein